MPSRNGWSTARPAEALMTPMPALRTALLLLSLWLAAPAAAQLPEVTLTIDGHAVTAEVAATFESRSQGLMHRRMLPENRGMLFVFREPGAHAMWMKNTYIPLSVAFLDEKGRIINIADMQPHTEDAHGASSPARYALEMNLGWFARRKIKPGARLEGLEKVPQAR